MRRCFSCACLVALLTGVVHADDVLLKGGARISGRILSRTATTVEVDVGAGIVTIPMSSVERIDERRSPLVEYHERAAPLGDADSNGWLQLATWATGQGLGAQARTAYEKVVSVDPAHAEANQALGRVQLDGRWVTEEESYRARGYVRFEGEWTTAAERDAILGVRAAASRSGWPASMPSGACGRPRRARVRPRRGLVTPKPQCQGTPASCCGGAGGGRPSGRLRRPVRPRRHGPRRPTRCRRCIPRSRSSRHCRLLFPRHHRLLHRPHLEVVPRGRAGRRANTADHDARSWGSRAPRHSQPGHAPASPSRSRADAMCARWRWTCSR
jgi:hypothetical protein